MPKKQLYESTLNQDGYEEYLEQIGRITANYGFFEIWFLLLFSNLLRTNVRQASVVFFAIENRMRLDMCHSLGKLLWSEESEQYQALKKLLGTMSDAVSGRNSISHSLWSVDDIVSRHTFQSRGGNFNTEQLNETKNSLRSKGDKLGYATAEIMSFLSAGHFDSAYLPNSADFAWLGIYPPQDPAQSMDTDNPHPASNDDKP